MDKSTAIVMPKLGLTMTEGMLSSWRVSPGDQVTAGDVLFVVETEKVATEIESPKDGQIDSILVAEGETVAVGLAVATWKSGSLSDRKTSEPVETWHTKIDESVAKATVGQTDGLRIVATPLARRLARQNNVGLDGVAGSGPRGRIKAADVETFVSAVQEQAKTRQAESKQPASAGSSIIHTGARGSRRPATQIEKVVARRLTASKQTAPHFYVFANADVTKLLALRDELNADGKRLRLSITHFVLAAVACALSERPELNVLWRDDEVVTLEDIDIGLAVDTPKGLLVPVLRNLGDRGLYALAKSAAEMVEKARSGTLDVDDFEGGAFSVSNVGMFGASHLVPIINPGQSAILGVAAVQSVFRPDEEGAPRLRQELGLVLSADHRVLDGVRAAGFLNRITQILERPILLLM